MPIYEYVCDDCGQRYEQIVLSQTQQVACPKCSSGRHTLQLSVFAVSESRKLFSAHGVSWGSGAASSDAPYRAEGGGSCACGLGGCGLDSRLRTTGTGN